VGVLLLAVSSSLARNYISHNQKSKEIKAEDKSLTKGRESSSIQGVIEESGRQ